MESGRLVRYLAQLSVSASDCINPALPRRTPDARVMVGYSEMDLHVLDHVPDVEETDARSDVFMRIACMRRGRGDKSLSYRTRREGGEWVTGSFKMFRFR